VFPENIHTPTTEGHSEEGRGVLNGKSFQGKYEPKLEFLEGRRIQTKNPPWWNNTLKSN